MPKLKEVVFTVLHERVRFANTDGPDTAIVICQESVPDRMFDGPDTAIVRTNVKVDCEPGDLVPDLSYRFYGHWTNHAKYGQQFHAKTFVSVQPHSMEGIVKYLMQAPNIGRVTALAL